MSTTPSVSQRASASYTRERSFLAVGERAMQDVFRGDQTPLNKIVIDANSEDQQVSETGLMALKGVISFAYRTLRSLAASGRITYGVGFQGEVEADYALATRNWKALSHQLSVFVSIAAGLRAKGKLSFREDNTNPARPGYAVTFAPFPHPKK